MAEQTIFSKILAGEIPASKVYEDNNTLAFLDINPVNKGHTLVIPKNYSRNLLDINDNDLSKLILVVKKIAIAVKNALNADGINILMNNESASGQQVFHTHFHIIPRFTNDKVAKYKQKKYDDNDDIKNTQEKIITALK